MKNLLQILRARWKMVAALSVLALALIIWGIVWLPQILVNWVYQGDPHHPLESANNYAKLVDDYRKTVVQIVGGAFQLIGGVLLGVGVYLTHRRTKATEETLRVSQRTLEVTRETQITDRFTKAISQLGAVDSQGKKQMETRLGAIYALERIAKDSEPDHWPIMQILTAYVRHNTISTEPDDAYIQTDSTTVGNDCKDSKPSDLNRPPDKDVQAILNVIGRRLHTRENAEMDLDLRATTLMRANLVNAHLERADLIHANLRGASLREAHLDGAYLIYAHLESAGLVNAHLKAADLRQAHLEGAFLTGANLEGAVLLGAHLEQEVLNEAYGDYETQLPTHLTYPDHWPKRPEESPSDT